MTGSIQKVALKVGKLSIEINILTLFLLLGFV